MRIKQLSPSLANQIAAGEVIERPASVVKELLENSLDAQATAIDIELGYGGLNQIKISDNGSGIVADDLPLAIAAHATSKIASLADLYNIHSMGFRGEALASIASIARVMISSKPALQDHAMKLMVRGDQHTLSPCARTQGTTIEVLDLFYNAPVRKRFLKNERLEFQAIEAVVKRFALSAPHIALKLTHNSKLLLSIPAALNEKSQQLRIAKVLGKTFISNALFLDVEQSGMRLRGWISGINNQRSQNDRQWVYINQRMVKDKLISHALKQAYDGLLHPGRFSSCLLYFSINSEEVDVNVHPTKHEVRFQQPRLVHDFFVSQLVKALRLEKVSDPAANEEQKNSAPSYNNEIREAAFNYHVVRNLPSCSPSRVQSDEEVPWTILNQTYSLFWLHQEPFIVDVEHLYQSWLEDKLKKAEYPLASRPLLVPINVPFLMDKEFDFNGLEKLANAFGIILEVFDSELRIRTIPIMLPYLDLKKLFQNLKNLKSLSMEQFCTPVINAQVLNISALCFEERMELSQYMKHNAINGVSCKPITKELCRMLLNA